MSSGDFHQTPKAHFRYYNVRKNIITSDVTKLHLAGVSNREELGVFKSGHFCMDAPSPRQKSDPAHAIWWVAEPFPFQNHGCSWCQHAVGSFFFPQLQSKEGDHCI